MKKNPRTGFTLVELLVVVAILGILATLIIPAVGNALNSARRAKDMNNLRGIGLAAAAYATEHDGFFPGTSVPALDGSGASVPATAHLWVAALARFNPDMGRAELYYSLLDPQRAAQPPVNVLNSARDGLAADFQASVLAYEFVGGLRAGGPAVPLAFTRGLTAQGVWDAAKGVYGDHGGYILFTDGRVQFYRNTREAASQFVATNNKPTANLLEALPYSASALSNPRVYADADYGGIGSPAGTAALPPP